jgi:hypothetical protein
VGQPDQLLGSLLPQKLTDIIIGFSIVDVLNFFRAAVVDRLFIGQKDFVVGLHMISQFLKYENSFACFYYNYRPFYDRSISIPDVISIVFELFLRNFFLFSEA